MSEFPIIEAELTFIPPEHGGRSQSFGPNALKTRSYRPHIVLDDVNQRQPAPGLTNAVKQLTDEYLGVAFCDGPESVPFGELIKAKMILLYYPNLAYSEVLPGKTFTVREGAHVVAYGTVTSRYLGHNSG